MKRLIRSGILLALGLALVVWLRPAALALYHLEAGGRALDRAQALPTANPAENGTSPAPSEPSPLDQALRHFGRAVQLTPADGYAYRRLGQAWLAAGNNEGARDALSQAAELRPHDPMIHIELGHAWDGLGEAEKAVVEYEQGRYGPAVSEALVNYLKLADWQIAAQGGETALKILQGKVLALDPDNLPALVRVASIYEGMSTEGAEFALPTRKLLQRFPAASVALPAEPRLVEYLAQAMATLAEDGTWTRETLLHVVTYQAQQGVEGEAAAGVDRLLRALLARRPGDVDLLAVQADLEEQRGHLDEARGVYERLLDADPQYAPAWLRLALISRSRVGEPPDASWLKSMVRQSRQYYELAPEDPLALRVLADACAAVEQMPSGLDGEGGNCQLTMEQEPGTTGSRTAALDAAWRERMSTAQPAYAVRQTLDNGWTLLGYDGDEERLVQGLTADLVLYWTGPATATLGPDEAGWYRAGDRWIQVVIGVRNLAVNGGFELGVKGGLPAGFPFDVGPTDLGVRQVVRDVRGGRMSSVALLDNNEDNTQSGFSSLHVSVEPDKLYLQSGWIRTDGGIAYLGRRWTGDLGAGVIPTTYAVGGAQPQEWQHYAGVAQPPAGATRCVLWLLNYRASGRVYFDNLLFIEIGSP